ncbi:MAG: carbon-nitrogen hydrolase family protein [Candidatus Rokubacteria bacterium]|nr:carbon-nitrogen hydrolase family protein [Candidatus Rokubacteria bacterium]
MRVAVVQMNSRDDKVANLAKAGALLAEAAARGVDLVVLPELWTYLGPKDRHARVAEAIPGPTSDFLAGLACRHRFWLVAGSYLEMAAGQPRFFNTCLALSPDGEIVARYRKLHLFDVDVDGYSYRESATMTPGQEVVSTELGGVRVGLTICYDLRFPELYRRLAVGGARIITVPSAFTRETGKDHWEVLLRARAVENQVFILAGAQVGSHPPGNACYGNALIADPWGVVLARAGYQECVVTAELDLDYQEQVRKELPSLEHRRSDLFTF